jgi:methylphosphotriester-DNA--protein-cysteine methyltransferase
LFDNINGKLLTDVTFTIKQIADNAEGSESVKNIAPVADVKTALSVTDAGGDGSLAYNSTTGVITYTGPSAANVRAHFSAGTGIGITDGAISTSITQYTDALARGAVSVTDSGGDGSLAYNNSTGVFTFTGPSAANVRAHFSASTGISITDGAISTTITQYTDALARGAISVTDSGGDGSLAYNNSTGVFTFTGPSATDVRAHFSAGSGITITNGAVAVDSTIATKTYADNAATTAVAAVIDAAPATLDTLNELAAALGDDANFSTTITTSIGTKLNSSAVSTFGLTLVDDADAATARTTLGLGTAATTASSAYATAAQGTKADNALPASSVSTFGGTLIDDADAATARTTLGLGNVTNESKATMFSGPTFTGTAVLPSTTSIGDVSSTELGYLDGVTSSIQTQLNGKQASSSYLTDIVALSRTDGNFIVANGSTWVAESGSTARDSLTLGTGSSVRFSSFGVGTDASGTAGEIRATNNITAYYSDDRLKTRLGTIDNALQKVESLTGFYYHANETAQELGYEVRKEVGLSAQEVEKILPEIVTNAPIDDKYKTIWYERMVPLLVEAIKELSTRVKELEER